jgi:hypothetical protein
MYLRFIISAYIRTNGFLYEAFLEHNQTIDDFVRTEIEPIDRDAD